MIVGIADTHSVIWYLSRDKRLSYRAEHFIEQAASQGNQIGIASITLVEIVYLIERNRIPVESFSKLAEELASHESVFIEVPLSLKIVRRLSEVEALQIPDMPDRIIAASAYHLSVPIITRDARILSSGMEAIW